MFEQMRHVLNRKDLQVPGNNMRKAVFRFQCDGTGAPGKPL